MRQATLIILMALLLVTSAAHSQKLVRREGGRDRGEVNLTVEKTSVRLVGKLDKVALSATLERTEDGFVVSYERELRDESGSVPLLHRLSIMPNDAGWRIRESGPLGARSRTVFGQSFDTVLDDAAPEIAAALLIEKKRRSFRGFDASSGDIKTVILEDRLGGARFADVPGAGFTAWIDDTGITRLVLPGAHGRIALRAGLASRPTSTLGIESQVNVTAKDGSVLSATLTLPLRLESSLVVCVLIPDLGPRDRDGLGVDCATPVLAYLADALSQYGVASIRADGRGVGSSSGGPQGLDGLADDALSLANAALSVSTLKSARVFMLGHGFGGVVAIEAARRKPDGVAGLAALAIPATSLAEALELRLRHRLLGLGEREEGIARATEDLRKSIEALKALPSDAKCPPESLLLRDLVQFDPAEQMAALRQPLFLLHASHDPEISMTHVARLRSSLAFAAGSRVTFRLVEPLDHDLLTAIPGRHASPYSADVARAPHPDVARFVAAFVKPPISR